MGGDRATPKRCFEHKKKKKKKKKKKRGWYTVTISFTKDVVYLCRGADTEVHSPQRPVTEGRALPCLTALYRFSARLSSAVSREPFDRSSSNLDTSIIRPLPFRRMKKKKNRKNSRKSKKIEK